MRQAITRYDDGAGDVEKHPPWPAFCVARTANKAQSKTPVNCTPLTRVQVLSGMSATASTEPSPSSFSLDFSHQRLKETLKQSATAGRAPLQIGPGFKGGWIHFSLYFNGLPRPKRGPTGVQHPDTNPVAKTTTTTTRA